MKQEMIDHIKQLYSTGNYTQKELAIEYGISRNSIRRIIQGKSQSGTGYSYK